MKLYGDWKELAELTESVICENKDAMINRICANDLSQTYGRECYECGDAASPEKAIEELASDVKMFFRTFPEFDNRVDWNQYKKIGIDELWRMVRSFNREIADRREAKKKVLDPDSIPQFTDRRDEGNGIVTYQVQDDEQGMMAVRKVVDSHWGEDKNPWCLISRGLTPGWAEGYGAGDWEAECDYCDPDMAGAYEYWSDRYNAKPKRIAFLNGRLLAFMAVEPVEIPPDGLNEQDARSAFKAAARRFDADPELSKRYDGSFSAYLGDQISSGLAEPDIENYLQEDRWGDSLVLIGDAVQDVWYGRSDEPHPSLYSVLKNYRQAYEKYRKYK